MPGKSNPKKKQERARRAGFRRLAKEGRVIMATRRVGLCFKDWQISILEELARAEGFAHVATFISHDLNKLYPTLKRRPVRDSSQMDLVELAKGTGKAIQRASGPARRSARR